MKVMAEISDALDSYQERDIDPGSSQVVLELSLADFDSQWVQLTYDMLRIAPDGEVLAAYDSRTGRWVIAMGEYEGCTATDLVVDFR